MVESLDPEILKRLRDSYFWHKNDAKRRGIGFEFTVDEWMEEWISSGKMLQRGCRKGQYVMARYNDIGPYRAGNIHIITVEENMREMWGNSEKTKLMRKRMSESHVGLKHSDASKKKMSEVKMGHEVSVETRLKMSQAIKGRKFH